MEDVVIAPVTVAVSSDLMDLLLDTAHLGVGE